MAQIKVVEVRLWGERVGALGWDAARNVAQFQYDAEFLRSGLNPAPLRLSATRQVQQFHELALGNRFMGLPGFIADSLPGKFGNQVLQAWLLTQGRRLQTLDPLERLTLVGNRGMGALEYLPDTLAQQQATAIPLHVGELINTALKVCTDQHGADKGELEPLVAASATVHGSKLLLGCQPGSDQFLSGQAAAPQGYEQWQLTFDSDTAADAALRAHAGRIEYAYHEMAHHAGVNVMDTRLHHVGRNAYFMSRRFDRIEGNGKLHCVSFAGLAHADDNPAGAYGYEHLFQAIRELRLGQEALNEMYRRMLFNICARNLDDGTRNHHFLMFGDGQWQLAPAGDLNFSPQVSGRAIAHHRMSCNGKRDDFTLEDLLQAAKAADVKRPLQQLERVQDAIARWPEFAEQAGLNERLTMQIGLQHRSFVSASTSAPVRDVTEGPTQQSLF